MAYALLCAGGSGTSAPVISMPMPWTPSNQADWGCRIKIKTGSDITTDRMICGNEANGFGNDRFKFAVTSGAIVCLYGPYWNTTDWLRYVVTANTEYDLLYRVTSTQFQLWNNATNTLLVSKTLGVRAASGSVMARNVVGRTAAQNSAQSPAGMIYYNVDFIDYATPANTLNYDANLSGGTGTTFPTTQGTNNGTQVGTWPANDAEWVFYSDGGAVTASATYDIGGIEFAISANEIDPAITAAVGYDIGGLSFAVSSTVTAPGFTASLNYDIGSIGFAASATVGVNASGAYDIGSVGFDVSASAATNNAIASVAYDVGSIGFAVNSLVSSVNTASTSYDIGATEFAVSSILVTNASGAVNYDIGGVTYSINANAPLNEPERSLSGKDNPFWRKSIFFNTQRRY